MADQTVEDPIAFFASLGGLHDVEIEAISINFVDQTLTVAVEDLHANFADLPEHPGCRPATLVFDEVTDLFVDVDMDEGIRISHARIVSQPPKMRVDIDLNIGYGSITEGRPKLTAKFRSLQIEEGPCESRDPSSD